ncbi:TPA: hypothetical protein P7B18_004663 [Escherichia coli]|nr:hypothetical protein [Escherichia coli]HBN1457468.1 hypothetical protein [Escherichia coli]HDP7825458.1 hypothetical protein [Escherichia coli]
MKQMTLIEMDGFLKGKCIPSDLKVNETNAEYLVRKFAEAEAKCAALAAENAGLKAGAMYFSYGSEFSFECHKTAEEAIAAAEAAIDDYRGDACDGWSEEVESICWGVIIQQATKVGERKKRKCDRVSPWIERVCDYELRPNVETPATDALLDEIERKAIRKFINSIEHILRDKLSPYDTEEMLEAMRIFLEEQSGEQK